MITIHSINANDFSGNGLGVLFPSICIVKERAGGDFSLYIEHPITDDGRWLLIQSGGYIKCPTPKRETPFITNKFDGTAETPARVIYRTKNKASLRTKGYVDAPVIEWLKKGTEVLFVGTMGMVNHSVVTSPSGNTGRIFNEVIEYLRTEPAIPGQPAYNSIVPARQVREQLFKIYNPVLDSAKNVIKAWARHISYNQLGAIVIGYNPQHASPALALANMKSALDHDEGFHYFTNLTESFSAEWSDKNAVFAIQDPDQGIVRKLNAQLVRDNFDVFILKNEEMNRGVVVEAGKNMLGVRVKISEANLVTRLYPISARKDGQKIILPEKFVDSENINKYPHPKTKAFVVNLEKELSQAQAYEKMRNACRAEFEKGIDLPDFDIEVDFVNLGDTEEYKQFKDLQQVFLYDQVRVKDAKFGIDYKASVTEFEFDAIAERYNYVKLGKINSVEEVGSVAGYQISESGLTGNKLSLASVGSQHLRSFSVSNAHIQHGAIESAQIKHASIDNAHIKDGAITKAKIANASIDGAKIEDAAIGNAKIDSAGIDYAKIKDLTVDTAIIEAGVGEKLLMRRLSVTEANIVNLSAGRLLVQGQDGAMYQITVDEQGTVKTILRQISNSDVADVSLNASEKIIKGTIVADLLNVQEIFAHSALVGAIKAVNIKAGSITVDRLSSDVGNSLDISGNAAIKLKVDKSELATKPGDNLLPRTYNPLKIEPWRLLTEGRLYAEKYSDYPVPYFAISNSAGNTARVACSKIYTAEALKRGDFLTLQLQCYPSTLQMRCSILTDNGSVVSSVKLERYGTLASNAAWGLYKGTFELPEDLDSSAEIEITVLSESPTANIWFREAKLERGKEATAYSPSVYDGLDGVKTSHIELRDNLIDIKSGGIVNIESGGNLRLSGGTVQIESDHGAGSYLNFGDVFSMGEDASGQFRVKVNGKDDGAITVNGKSVWHKGNIVVGENQPQSGHGVLWIKPNATSEVRYAKQTANGQQFCFGWGYGDDGYLNIPLSALNNDVITSGTFDISLSFVLRRKGFNAAGWKNYGKVRVMLQKGGQTLSASSDVDLNTRAYINNLYNFNFSTTSNVFTANTSDMVFKIKVDYPQYSDGDFLCFEVPGEVACKVKGQSSQGAALCEVRYVP